MRGKTASPRCRRNRKVHALLGVVLALAALAALAPVALSITVTGDGGNNDLAGTNRQDMLSGLGGNDRLFGKRGLDTLDGGADGDLLFPGDGKDVANGGDGVDTFIDDDSGDDVLNGEDGNDDIRAANGDDDTVDCGTGTSDQAFVDTDDTVTNCETVVSADGVAIGLNNVFGTNGPDTLSGFGRVRLIGKHGKDTLDGGDLPDELFPGDGKDIVNGGDETVGGDQIFDDDDDRDVLNGEGGNDGIFAANGEADTVDCGAGTDTALVDADDTVIACETVITP
jgi:Ca2+-binding RTX toxin-like protein